MNVWKTVALATAVVALLAPAANAKFDSSSPSKALHAKVLKHKRVAPKVTTKTSSRVLIIVSTFTPGPQTMSGDSCEMSGNNCTDQKLCELWGMNCDLVAVSPSIDAATESQSANS